MYEKYLADHMTVTYTRRVLWILTDKKVILTSIKKIRKKNCVGPNDISIILLQHSVQATGIFLAGVFKLYLMSRSFL